MNKQITLISFFTFMLLSTGLFAQYQGGAGDGYAKASLKIDYEDNNTSSSLVYPNPSETNGLLFIKEPANRIELYNCIGQLIQKYELENQTQIDLSTLGLSPGVYCLRLKFQASEKTERIILQ